MPNVMGEISSWGNSLQYWERAALDMIVSGTGFTEETYKQLLDYLLEDNGLSDSKTERPKLSYLENTGQNEHLPRTTAKLAKICNLQNVNALVRGQELPFGPALTAIYGQNGSGKSGYARVLGCVGFTRGDKQVLPDVTKPADPNAARTADLVLSDGRTVQYEVGKPCAELSTYYAFDTTSVQVHLNQENELSFSPAGLSCLGRLAEETDQVRDLLRAEIEAAKEPHGFGPMFMGDSVVSSIIHGLGADTDIAHLRKLAMVEREERELCKQLDLRIAEVKAEKIPERIKDLGQASEDLSSLRERLSGTDDRLSEQTVKKLGAMIQSCSQLHEQAKDLSIEQFRSDRFGHVGTPEWRDFIRAARALANMEPDRDYPLEEDICLFCRQPLSTSARELIVKLWEFLGAEIESRLSEAIAEVEAKRKAFSDLDLGFFDKESVFYRTLVKHDQELCRRIEGSLSVARQRRAAVVSALNSLKAPACPELSPAPLGALREAIVRLEAECAALREQDHGVRIGELENQKRELDHRLTLAGHCAEIEAYVHKRVWADKASKAVGSTRQITEKHNALFKDLVTNRYVGLFQKALEDLGRPMSIRLQTRGQKGSALKQIVLEADPSLTQKRMKPGDVLSEGEKRAVALADFLTEVTLDEACTGIILDDPVTSLDVDWKDTVARRMVTEAKDHQVIIFTHDLHFLYLLNACAKEASIELDCHYVKRGDTDQRPGYVFANNSPLTERDFRKTTRAREYHTRALKAQPAEQEALLSQGFGALRSTYEAFVVFDLFNEVVMRFGERISYGRLRDIVWDEGIVNEIIAKYELLSSYIEGHSHSDTCAAKKPSPALLLQEIDTFDKLKERHRLMARTR